MMERLSCWPVFIYIGPETFLREKTCRPLLSWCNSCPVVANHDLVWENLTRFGPRQSEYLLYTYCKRAANWRQRWIDCT